MDIHNEFTYRHGCFAPALLIITIILLGSCRTTKQVSTSRVNTDSIVSEEKRKLTEVHQKETAELRKMIEEMTSSGVTFVVDSCPERDAVLALLDSAGRANYEKARLQDKVKSLSNKVTISEKGLITAEGNIKAAYFTSSKLQEELSRTEKTIDSLTVENERKDTQLNKTAVTKDKDVKRTSPIPWMIFLLACCASCFIGWWARGKITIKSINTTNMKTLLIVLGLFTLTACGGAGEKPTDNITFGQAWKYAWTLPAYYGWIIAAVVGGAVAGYFLYRDYQKKQNWSGGHMGILVVIVALVLAAFLATPAVIAENTTVEQAARGVYIR